MRHQVRLRLSRWGVARNPFYGIVAANARSPRDSKYIERLGTYNPTPDQNGVKQVQLNFERTKFWLSNGAEPSPRVEYLLIKAGILPPSPTYLRQRDIEPKR